MRLFLIEHFEGCTPLEPCRSCTAAMFLRDKLAKADFDHLIRLANGSAITPAPLDTLLDTIHFSVRTANCLKNDNLVTIGDLVKKTPAEILRTPNMGRRSLAEIQEALEKLGHKLRTPGE